MTTQETNGSGTQPEPAVPLTQADIPAVVQAVTATLQERLKEQRPPPPADGDHDPTDPGEGTSTQSGKLPAIIYSPSAVQCSATVGALILWARHYYC